MLYHFHDCELDDSLYQLRRAGEPVEVERKVFDVLAYLLHHRDRIISKDELLDKLWPSLVVTETALTRCIVAARKALGDDVNRQDFIKTQHGRGYRFVAPLTTQPVQSSMFQVPSQEEEVSSQYSGVSRQQAKGENGLEFSVQSLVQDGQGVESKTAADALPKDQPLDPRLSDSRLSDPRHQPLDVSPVQTPDVATPPAQRPWVIRRFVLMGLLLLVGISAVVQYLSWPTPNPQPLTPSPQPLPFPDKPSIVVLPFTNLSGDPAQEYFSDGLTAMLTGDLSKISSLFVIARHSAFTYKGKAVKMQEVSKELGVRYVVEGSVLKADNRVRITTQLIDATTSYHLWSEQYDRPLQDLFTLQDEIVQQIVTTLKLQLTLREQGYSPRKHTANLDAYDALLRGMEVVFRYTKESHTQARQLFEKALALDPQYAEAYAWLSRISYQEWVWRWSVDPQTLERVVALAQQAITLDDSLPFAHSLLSEGYALQQQYDQATAEGERAIALDPNNADSYAWQAEVLNFADRPEEALKMVKQAMRLNPRYPPFYLNRLGWAYNLTGRYAEAIATLKETISRSPNFLGAYLFLASSYIAQWDFQLSPDTQTLEQALAAAQRIIALNDSVFWGHSLLGHVYLRQKQYDQAIAEMERAIALDPNDPSGYVGLALTLGFMGRSEEALQMVEQALRHKPSIVDENLAGIGAAYALAGRPEEAIALLQRFITRRPNILGTHLVLAAAYSKLGKEAEARAEAAEVLRLNPLFSLEVHKQRVPIKDQARLERAIAALRKAGLK